MFTQLPCLKLTNRTWKWMASFWGQFGPIFRCKFLLFVSGSFPISLMVLEVFWEGRLMCDGHPSNLIHRSRPAHPDPTIHPGRTCNHGNECRLQARSKHVILEVFLLKITWNLCLKLKVMFDPFFHFQIITTSSFREYMFCFFPIIITAYLRLGGDFKHVLFLPLPAEMESNPIWRLHIFFKWVWWKKTPTSKMTQGLVTMTPWRLTIPLPTSRWQPGDLGCLALAGPGIGQVQLDVSKNNGIPKMDGLQWKTLVKWMIWGYPYFRKHPAIVMFHVIFFFGIVNLDLFQMSFFTF